MAIIVGDPTTTTTANDTSFFATIKPGAGGLFEIAIAEEDDEDREWWLVIFLIPLCCVVFLLRRDRKKEDDLEAMAFPAVPKLVKPTLGIVRSGDADGELRTLAATMFCADEHSQIVFTLDGSNPQTNPAAHVYSPADYPSFSLASDSVDESVTVRAVAVCSKLSARNSDEATMELKIPKVAAPTFQRRSDAAAAALTKMQKPNLIKKRTCDPARVRQVLSTTFKLAEMQYNPATQGGEDEGWALVTNKDDANRNLVLENPLYSATFVPSGADDHGGYLDVVPNGDMPANKERPALSRWPRSQKTMNPLLVHVNSLSVVELETRYYAAAETEFNAVNEMAKYSAGEQGYATANALAVEAETQKENIVSALSAATLSDEIEINSNINGDCFYTIDKTLAEVTLDRSQGRRIGAVLGDAVSPTAGVRILVVDPSEQAYEKLFVEDEIVAVNGESSLGLTKLEAGQLASQHGTDTVVLSVKRAPRTPHFGIVGHGEGQQFNAKLGTIKYGDMCRPCLPPARGTLHAHDMLCGINIQACGAKIDWRCSNTAKCTAIRDRASSPRIVGTPVTVAGVEKIIFSLTCETEGADIYYAVYIGRGSGVTSGELQLHSPNNLVEVVASASSVIVRAIAVHPDMCSSDLCEFRQEGCRRATVWSEDVDNIMTLEHAVGTPEIATPKRDYYSDSSPTPTVMSPEFKCPLSLVSPERTMDARVPSFATPETEGPWVAKPNGRSPRASQLHDVLAELSDHIMRHVHTFNGDSDDTRIDIDEWRKGCKTHDLALKFDMVMQKFPELKSVDMIFEKLHKADAVDQRSPLSVLQIVTGFRTMSNRVNVDHTPNTVNPPTMSPVMSPMSPEYYKNLGAFQSPRSPFVGHTALPKHKTSPV